MIRYIKNEQHYNLLLEQIAKVKHAFQDCTIFIITTHSPFILSTPGARIYNLDSMPISTEQWYNLDNTRSYYQLFKDNESLFNK